MATIITEHPLGTSTIIYEPPRDSLSSLTPSPETLLHFLKGMDYIGGTYDDYKVSRDQRWYHMENKYMNPHWPIYERWKSHKYEPELITLQSVIGKYVTKRLKLDVLWEANSLLINKYATGHNVIQKHRDSEVIFGDNPIVAVLSVGATRTLRFTPVSPYSKSLKIPETLKGVISNVEIEVESGSLVIMAGTTQKYYCHELLHDETVEDERYSLTFRYNVL